MKKFLSTIVLFCFAFCGFAQEHLSFKGIPIEGSTTAFCQKLKSKGFEIIEQNDQLALLSGDFTGRNVTVVVVSTNDGKNVYSVGVSFDSSDNWKTLVSSYEHYKTLYTEKYGEPSITKEYNPAFSDSNIVLMSELKQGTVDYRSIWETAGGKIMISIRKSTNKVGYYGEVMIFYLDNQSAETQRKQDLDEI